MQKIFKKIHSEADFNEAFHIMKELRPHLNEQDFRNIYDQSHKADGYEIIAITVGGQIAGLMGYRILSDYVRGRHLYIDDLVTTEKFRSQGLGADLLIHAEEVARSKNCKVLRLCTGIENKRAIQFYEKNAWKKRAFAYTKSLS